MDKLEEMIEQINQERLFKPAVPQKYVCPKCKDSGFLYRIDKDGYKINRKCDCVLIKNQQDMMRRSGISAGFLEKTFDNFNTMGNAQLSNAKAKAMRYAENFRETEHGRHNSILFCGQVGSGKTHLGMAICSSLMGKGIEVMYMAYRNAVTRIKQNIIDEEGYSREMNRYTGARVLYIDDLLKGKLTETDVNVLYEIVNYRYMNNMPIIISTEKNQNDLLVFDEATGSRLLEMCRGNIIRLEGKELNYRLYQLG